MAILNKHKDVIPPEAVYIGRGSKWENPFDTDTNKHIAWFTEQINSGKISLKELAELHGKDLVCYCSPSRCHGEIIVQAANWAFTELLKQEQSESKEENMKIAIIGTAGRDKSKPMTIQTWNWMLDVSRELVPSGTHLVSGGAAWADHIAVQLFIEGHAGNLTLHLPAPLTSNGYIGEYGTSGGAANYYHSRFSNVIGVNTFEQLMECALHENCTGTMQEVAEGYGAMFVRNKAVVQELNPKTDFMFAFTFGTNGVADGGTKQTWDMFDSVNKHHLQLPIF